jgi:fatty acyl-CoA reductase
VIREALQGKRVVLTGVTGFLGSALLERLLFDVPVERIDVVIRGDAEKRLKWLLESSAFSSGRSALGDDFEETLARKVRAISCDLAAEDPAIDSDIDLVIHSAATVSFDPPIQEAFSTNLFGTLRLFEAARGRPFIHVSTAYVAGVTRGTQPEEQLNRSVDWKAESAAALEMADQVERESRFPEALEKLEAKARGEMGKAGPQSVAVRAEELRKEWVSERLVDAGRTRARSLGWPDVYGFTKALTEQALDETSGADPLVIVRPSIIESALERPFPGWIEGFRMADPIFLAYGRGNLPDFPGIPEGVLDLIPVDMVVNAILAVAALAPNDRAVYHVCSGERNPLKFRRIYEFTRDYFLKHPLPERDRGTYKVPEWSFPGKRAVDRRLKTAKRAIETAERVVGRLPRNRFARESARKVDRLRRRFDFIKRYADLYGPYVEAEVIYTDRRTAALFDKLPEDDKRDFNFDPSSFTWEHYLEEVHLPTLTMPLRWPEATRPDPVVKIKEVRPTARRSSLHSMWREPSLTRMSRRPSSG